MKIDNLLNIDFLSLVKSMIRQLKIDNIDPKIVPVESIENGTTRNKACFNNSYLYCLSNSDCKYVLGYTQFHNIPIEHAWVKKGEKYFDVTLNDAKDMQYVSVVELSLHDLAAYVKKHKHAPGLYDYNAFIRRSSESSVR